MMETTFNINGKKITVTPTLADKVINYFDPVKGKSRFQARAQMALMGGYTGARRDRRETQSWNTQSNDADRDILPDLTTLRSRSRDAVRNIPIGTGIINSKVLNVVGTGLTPQPQIDRDVLGLSNEAAEAWEKDARRWFWLWAESKECDASRQLNFYEQQDVAFRQVLENGDILVLKKRFQRAGSPFYLKHQLIEADRLCNPDYKRDTATLAGGVERDENGAPKIYHILKQHPGSTTKGSKGEWIPVPAFGAKSGQPNIMHLFKMMRPGQSRGVPDLAPVLETLKQISRLTEAELMASVVSSMLTVFIETPTGNPDIPGMGTTGNTGATGAANTEGLELGNGAILGLLPGEKVTPVNPIRPNSGFDPFFVAIVKQIGAAVELPYEIVLKAFTASYSASRAAMLDAWRFYNCRRAWLASNYCQPTYEDVITEAVGMGWLAAPGFFDNAMIRRAYLGCLWVGDSQGQIDPLKEVNAAEKRLDLGITTLEEETIALTGGDWESKHPQQVKEHRMRKEGGLLKEATPAAPATPQDKPDTEEE